MAFDRERLTLVAGGCKTSVQPALWLYWNEDTDTVTTAGYMAHSALSVKDQVMVIPAAGTGITFYYVSAKRGNAATLTAVS